MARVAASTPVDFRALAFARFFAAVFFFGFFFVIFFFGAIAPNPSRPRERCAHWSRGPRFEKGEKRERAGKSRVIEK